MKKSADRFLTTHVGRLERPQQLTDRMLADHGGRPADAAFDALLGAAVADVVRQQAEAGIDIVTDGEFGKLSWNSYVTSRLSGWEWADDAPPRAILGKDRTDFAQYYADTARDGVHYARNPEGSRKRASFPVFSGPIDYVGHAHVLKDIENLKAALAGVPALEAFLPSVSPGSVRFDNRHYKNDEAYLFALADALHQEYRAITDAGLTLQVDDPVITAFWDMMLPDVDMKAFYSICEMRVDALNHALRGIDPAQVRVHVCWGSWHGPHSTDVPLELLMPLLNRMNVGGYVLEAGNARHEHEWRVWHDHRLPEGRLLYAGVVSHATDTIEHPELIAQRLERFAGAVGRENVIASTDCGLGYRVHPQIAWAKLKALRDGARLASARLWR